MASNRNNFQNQHKKQEYKEGQKILYLRAFNTDGSGIKIPPSPFTPLAGLMNNQFASQEFSLAQSLLSLGHLIAVGKPGEEIPEIGFDRKYFANEEWQEQVKNLMEESAMIVYRPDSTDGVVWEFEQILKYNYKNKIVIWTEVGDDTEYYLQKARYNIFRKKVTERFGETLPEFSRFNKFLSYTEETKWKSFFIISSTAIFKTIRDNQRT